MLTEEVGFGLFGEGGLDNAGTGAADSLGVGEADFANVVAGAFTQGDEAGDAAAFDEFGADQMAGALRGD